MSPKKSSKNGNRRTEIDTGTDKRYVRRNEQGEFKESDNVGRSLRQDKAIKAKKAAEKGQGDKGDHRS